MLRRKNKIIYYYNMRNMLTRKYNINIYAENIFFFFNKIKMIDTSHFYNNNIMYVCLNSKNN